MSDHYDRYNGMENLHGTNLAEVGTDCISRQQAIDALGELATFTEEWSCHTWMYTDDVYNAIKQLPPIHPVNNSEMPNSSDVISRQKAIDDIWTVSPLARLDRKWVDRWLRQLPSAQPERTCVNCGRTANNGGWYADGRTRCPIEEHYALPKDGYCHLWEKRNVTDDDYPERRTDEQTKD